MVNSTETRKTGLFVFMLLMLISGTCVTITVKFMDMLKVNGKSFNHPYFQTFSMFIGEFMCLIVYFSLKFLSRPRNNSQLTESLIEKPNRSGSLAWLTIPAIFDICGSTSILIGLSFSTPSVYQMLKGFLLVIVALYSVIFLKASLNLNQVLGISINFVGTVIIGIVSVAYKAPSAENPLLGIFFIMLGELFSGGFVVSEEMIFKKIKVNPLLAVGIEGSIGCLVYIIALPILYLIPCDYEGICNNGRVEDAYTAILGLLSNNTLALIWICSMVSVAVFNWSGISTTQKSSALTRAIIDASRSLSVWLVSMILHWEEFLPLQLLGFLLIMLGTIIYNSSVNWLKKNKETCTIS
ncbi:unnamed protein product [Blepharisma stoltei]|uniref:EamA domain-containing protein n=1 Tax=Blepharisma stoltei TaxID=1481888 RepID=A0AAU9JWK4_9CILI|nr:unnamed protein product [Blepharisma stoltei]